MCPAHGANKRSLVRAVLLVRGAFGYTCKLPQVGGCAGCERPRRRSGRRG
nr:MAG TPA: hypothetical protein [Caudoviricetes sp.]